MLPKPIVAVVAVLLSASAGAAQPGYRLAGSIPGPDGFWDLTSVDPVAHRLYVARPNGIMAIDLTTSKLTAAVAPARRPHAALVIPGTREVLATDGANDTATIFDGVSGKVRATIPTGKKPDAAAWDPATRTLWVMNAGSGDITVIDPVAAAVVDTVAVGGSLELGAADGEGRLFVNVEDHNDVAVIDTRSRKLTARFPLAGCDEPTGIAYAPEAKLLISACGNGKAIVSTRQGARRASLTIGAGPDGALYDASRHVALIPSGGEGTLAVIDVRGTPRVIERIATAKNARTAALDETTGRVYLSAADYQPRVGQERPPTVPGTYRVLVLEPVAPKP